MQQLPTEFRQKVRDAILVSRENYGGNDSEFAKTLGMSSSEYSQLKSGKIEKFLTDTRWITIGRKLNVSSRENNWKIVKTKVYEEIESNLAFCQNGSKSMILVDACGIGKTFSAKHIISTMKNAFYFDCSQAKSRQQFIRQLAKTVGLDNDGKYIEVKNQLKYYLTVLHCPLIVLDEAGDLEYTAFLELKELINATIGACGFYMMGADGLRAKIEKGIGAKKVGFAEIFSRFSDDFATIVPIGEDRKEFMSELIRDVASANVKNKSNIDALVRKCMKKDNATLRYLETVIQLNAA